VEPERWQQIEELYQAARDREPAERNAFLLDACRGDSGLRREVESLLNEPESDSFLAGPALHGAPFMLSEFSTPSMTGRSLGEYQLLELIGKGGMGEVYRARDRTLARDIAIKILPAAFTSNPNRLARFEREARMLAALNHPNICAIYGLEEVDGVRFLVLELVGGETLAERVPAGRGLPIADALRIARQIVDALEAAHEKGIVHRDLKPANIKITPDATVKVLDFGLAKAIDTEPPVAANGSRDGLILGTPAYMSPEQARGKDVDRRADIWAFGCVLYEVLTGQSTFGGETASDTIGRILEREPDWTALPPATPASIRTLLQRCLAKDAKQRTRDIGDVRIELDAIEGARTATAVVPASPIAKWRSSWLPWAVVAALVGLVGASELLRSRQPPAPPLANARFTRLTDWDGTEAAAQISADGKWVVFHSDRDGEDDLWLSQVGSERFVNITSDVPSIGPHESLVRRFGFSSDSSEIWRTRQQAQMLMPLTGGPLRTFLADGAAEPSWSPDGTHLVYFVTSNGDPLFVADTAGADAKQITGGDADAGLHNHSPVWSADGEWIYFLHGLDPTTEMDIWRIRPSGASLERLTQQDAAIFFLTPLDARTLLYVARDKDGSGPWLWSLDVPSRTRRRVDSGLDQYTSVSASRDGRHVVATVTHPTASLWRVPLRDQTVEESDVRPYPVAGTRVFAPRFAGHSLFYLAASETGDRLWRTGDTEPFEFHKGVDEMVSGPAAVSEDGQRMAVVVRRQNARQLMTMSADGTGSRTLASAINIQSAAGQAAADWSPDGAWIAAGGADDHGPGLFKIPTDGGAPVRIVDGRATNPAWSPDGQWIVYSGPLVGGQVTLQGVRTDGTPVNLPEVRLRQGSYRFLHHGSSLVYQPGHGSFDFWLLDLVTNRRRQLTHLSNRGALGTFDIPRCSEIVFDGIHRAQPVMLIELAPR
jgi:serine/threonine protein kinase